MILNDIIAVKRSMDWIYPAEWFPCEKSQPIGVHKDSCDDILLILSHLGRYLTKKNCSKLVFRDVQVFLSRNAEQIYLSQIIRSQEEMCRPFTGV